MNKTTRILCCSVVAASVFLLPTVGTAQSVTVRDSGGGPKSAAAHSSHLAESYGRLPLSFEPNAGQTDPRVKFLSHGGGHTLFLTSTEAVLSLTKKRDDGVSLHGANDKAARETESSVLRMRLLGANPDAVATGLEQLPGKSNYFIGNNPANWHTNVSTYGKVQFSHVYPGIDLVYYGNERDLENDFVVAPGADPAQIRLAIGGASKISLDADGNAVIGWKNGEVRLLKPGLYQEVRGETIEIAGGYALKGNELRLVVGQYDHRQKLVIDPVLSYSTYLGGSAIDYAYGIAVDSSGSAYVAGYTSSTNFPVSTAPEQGTYGGGSSAVFVAKLTPAGDALVYSTYIGGNGVNSDDGANGLAVDSSGNAYVVGYTQSTNFPGASSSSIQASYGGNGDGFVLELNAAGNALIYSTYLGGAGTDVTTAIALDSSGNAYVVGGTQSTNFPGVTSSSMQAANAGGGDAFVTKINPGGTAIVYSTYLGGTGADTAYGIAVDSSGNAFVVGVTSSTGFPGVNSNSLQPTNGGGTSDAFVAELNAAGTALVYSTFLGGNSTDFASGIALDSTGNAYVAGYTLSTNFPVTPGAFQAVSGGGYDGFVAKLNPGGTTLVYSTYLGGSGTDEGAGIAVDSSGNAYVTGGTTSTNFPGVSSSSVQSVYGGGTGDAFVAELNPAGSALVYSTYLGGNDADVARGIKLDSENNVYIAGYTSSTNFPLGAQPVQSTYGGGTYDAFIAKLSTGAATTTTIAASVNPSVLGQQVSFTATVKPTSSSALTPSGNVTFNDGATTLGTVTLTSGTAIVSTSVLSVGSHNITAAYAGDSSFASSTSTTLIQTVGQGATTPTSTTLSSSLSNTVYGQNVSLTAVVSASGGAPTGTVSFVDSGVNLGSAPISGGQAILNVSSLAPGSHFIAATYSGDATFISSTSVAVAESVSQAATTITLTPSSISVAFGQNVTFTASLSVVSPGAGTPTGSVSFNDSANTLASVPLGNSGTATFSTFTLTSGSHTISAVYPGDSNFQSSISAPLTETVSWPAPYQGPPSVLNITTGSGPVGMALNPATERIYVANQGSNNVTVIDATTNLVIAAIPVGKAPSAVAINSQTNKIYVADRDSADVAVIDGTSNLATFIPVPSTSAPDSIAIEPGTGNVYVGTGAAGVLAMINAASQQVTSPDPSALFGPIAITASPLSGRVYVADSEDSDLETYEGVTTFLLSSFGIGKPQALAINPPALYVADGAGNLYVVDERGTNSPLPLAAGLNPHAIAANPADNTIYVADQSPAAGQPATVTQFNASNNALLGTYLVGPSAVPARTPAPNKIAIDSSANVVYVANEGSNTVSILDGGLGNVLATVQTGITPTAVLVDPARCTAYVSNFGSGTVSVIQPSFNGPAVCLSAGSLVFGRVPVGSTSAPQTVILTNTGTSTLSISNIASTGGFLETDSCPTRQIPPGGQCAIQEAFAATMQGIASGLLTITDNAAGSPQIVTLTGAAVLPSTTQVTTNSPVVYGEAVSMTAQVTGSQGTPTGTVIFFEDGQTVLATVKLAANVSASFTTAFPFFLPVGSQHTITAVYNGDLNFGASVSPASAIVVNKDATFFSEAVQLQTPPLRVQVVVDASSPGGGIPTGTVIFQQGQSTVAALALDSRATGTMPVPLSSPGLYQFTAQYLGDGNFLPSTSKQFPVLITAPTVTTLTSSASSVVAGNGVSFTATVTAYPEIESTSVYGTLIFRDGATEFGRAPLIGTGASGTLTTPVFATGVPQGFGVGQHSITVEYQDSTGDYNGSKSASVVVTVTPTGGASGGAPGCACSTTGAYVSPATPVDPSSATLSPHGTYTVTGSINSSSPPDTATSLYITRNADQVVVFPQANLPITTNFGFSPDDSRFVFHYLNGSYDNVELYDLTVQPARRLVNAQSGANVTSSALSFSPSGRYFMYEYLYFNGATTLAHILIYQIQNVASQLLIYDSGDFPFVSVPSSGEDTFGVLGQGFSPDNPETTFVYSYVAGPNVAGQIPTQFNLVSLVTPKTVLASYPLTDVSDTPEYSPCGDVIALIRQLQAQATGADNVAEVDLTATATGKSLNPGGYMAATIQLSLNCTSGGQQVIDNSTLNSTGQSVTVTLAPNQGCSNTPTGQTVTVLPQDAGGSGLAPVTVTFNNVTAPGATTLNVSSSGPAPPSGTQPGSPVKYFYLTTTATFSSATVCISYADLTFGSSNIIVLHNENGTWEIPHQTIDTVHQTICATVTSFSPFIIAEQVSSPTVSSISAPGVGYGTAAIVTVSVNSSTGAVTGAVTLSVDGGAATSSTLTNGSAVFNLGVLNAGPHSLSASFAGGASFSASTASGTLTVSTVPLIATGPSVSRQYGQQNPTLNNVNYNGFVNGDTASSLGGTIICITTATSASPVGSYPITCSGLTSSNYSITYNAGTLAITSAPLTITANNRSKTYGQMVAFAGTEFSASGLINGDSIASVSLTSPGAVASATVAGSPYSITPGGAVGTGLGNYTITYVNGSLTVAPALLTIAAGNLSKVLNAPNPAFTWTAAGFVNGETASVLTSNPTCTTTAATNSPVGSYPITCSGAKAANYTFSYISGTLKILYSTTVGHVILQPINADGSSVWKQGRTIPAKFQVFDANQVSIGNAGVVTSFDLTQIIAGTVTSVDESVTSTTPDSAFRWDPTGQQWIFNISTSNLPAGQTYVFTITLNDGTVILFQFGLR
jgi:YVTN family beta-propeller protein